MDYLTREGIDIPARFIHVPRFPKQVLEQRAPSMTAELIAMALEVVVDVISKELE